MALAPVISSFSPDTGNPDTTNQDVLTLVGTAPDNSTVDIYSGSTLLGTTTASSTGAWSFTSPALANGTYSFTATDIVSGATSAASAPLVVNVVPATSVTKVAASPGSGTEFSGDKITLTVDMTAPVTVTGTPTLTLNNGGIATYSGGSGTNALAFSYTIAGGQSTAGLAATAINLNTATITDDAGNAANLSLPNPPSIPSGSGKQYWVSPNGSDTADGLSQATAFKTLQRAQSVTNPGDVVNVLPGTYTAPNARDVLQINRAGSAAAWITYKAAPGAKIQVSPNNWMGVEVLAPYIIVQGFEIIGNARNVTMDFALQHAQDGTIPQTNSYGVGIGSHHVRILDNKIHDNSGHGIGGGGDYVVISGNEVYGNGNWSPYATGGVSQVQQGAQQFDDAPGYHNFIIGNSIHDNVELIGNAWAGGAITDGNGIIIDSNQLGTTPYTGRTLISNNVLTNNGAAGVHVYQSAHVDVFFNTSVNNNLNVKEGEIEASRSSDVRMLSNIMVARLGSYATGGGYSDTNVTYDYNFVSGPATYGATPHGPHDILADQLFGQFGAWTPIGAVQTANGYEVAVKNSGTGQYSVWTTDSNGTYTGNLIGAVSGNSYALESLEPAFDEDLNGDGLIGPPTPSPTLSVTSIASAIGGQVTNLSSLVTISDPGFVGYQQLELWDSNGTVSGGQFVVNGVAQTGGHEIDVSPANVATAVFDVGTSGGTDTLWARLLQNDGSLTPWQQFNVTVPQPTLNVTSIGSAIGGEVLDLSNLVTISDPGFVGYQQLELWDPNGTVSGGQFVVNGVAQTGGHEIDVSPANVATAVFDDGTSGGTDTLWARLLQNDGSLTSWQQFNVTVPQPTLNVTSIGSAIGAEVLDLSSLITTTDPGFVGYQQLELWDFNGTAAGGQFVVKGVPQSGGHEIDVSPANVANTVFDVGKSGGTDTLWARLLQNDGSLTPWQQFNVTVPQPTLNVTSIGSAIGGEVLDLSSLITTTDPGFVGYQQLELWDFNGTAAGGQFVVKGVPQSGGHEIDVSPANAANTVFDVGKSGGTDTLWARLLQNDGSLTPWQQFSVTVPQPTLNVTSIGSAIGGEVLDLSSLVTTTDPGFVGYQQLELWDSNGTAAGGQFVVNRVPQSGGREIDVSPANIANTVFDVGKSGGTDTLWARVLQSDGSLTPWQQFSVTVPQPTLNVTSIGTAIGGEVLDLSSLVTTSDPGFVGYQQLELWDSNGTLAGGQFVVNGMPQTGGHEIDVSPANVANTLFDVGTAGGTATLWARLLQNDGTLTPWQQFTVTDPVTVATGANVELHAAFVGLVTFAGSTGTLKLDQSQSFSGTIEGFGGQDQIDLADVGYGAKSTLGYLANSNNTGGTLTINDGTHTATLALLGQYIAGSFIAASDGHGGTLVSDEALSASATQTPVVTHPHA